jgi:drug/metabolite transporter (DMT)-like permease
VITTLLIALIVLADTAADVFLTKGMRQIGEVSSFAPRELLVVAGRALSNHHVLASMVFMAMHLAGFLIVLSWADLSFVFPATAMVYVVGTLAAKFILGESISAHRWAGTTLVCVGVGLVSIP